MHILFSSSTREQFEKKTFTIFFQTKCSKQFYDLLAAVVRTSMVFIVLNGQYIEIYVDVFITMIHNIFEFHLYSLCGSAIVILFLVDCFLRSTFTHYDENIISSLFCVMFFVFLDIFFFCCSILQYTFIHANDDEREKMFIYNFSGVSL